MESVSEAERMLMPNLKNSTNKPRPEQAVNHRWHARQADDGQAQHARPGVVAGILGKVDPGGQPQRDGKRGCPQHQVERADDGRQDAARAHAVARHGGQEFPRDARAALDGDIHHYPQDGQHGDKRDQAQEGESQRLDGILAQAWASPVHVIGRFHETTCARLLAERFLMELAEDTLMISEKMKRMMPMKNSTW